MDKDQDQTIRAETTDLHKKENRDQAPKIETTSTTHPSRTTKPDPQTETRLTEKQTERHRPGEIE